MACNCTTDEALKRLHEKYGNPLMPKKGETLMLTVRNFITSFFVCLAMVFIVPALFIYLFYIVLFGKDNKISLRKFFGLKEIDWDDYKRRQQELQGSYVD